MTFALSPHDHNGPSYCSDCGGWPASGSEFGLLCHMCFTRALAAVNPVPLPQSRKALEDLASLGYEPAIRKLHETPPAN